MKIKKITAEDRKRVHGIVSALKEGEKDEALAYLILFADRTKWALQELIKQSTLTAKEKREIEESISLGPQWLNYKRTVKRAK